MNDRKLHPPATKRRILFAGRRAVWFAFALVLPIGAQNGPLGSHMPSPQQQNQRLGALEDSGNTRDIEQEKRLRALNAERQRSLVSDTNRLLQLVNELNAELSSANTASLTSAQVHKMDQVEKLAHNVKQKMSTSVRPLLQEPPAPFR
jgi:hypothetical protein